MDVKSGQPVVAEGFEAVADVFRSNFDSLGEVGAGFSYYHNE